MRRFMLHPVLHAMLVGLLSLSVSFCCCQLGCGDYAAASTSETVTTSVPCCGGCCSETPTDDRDHEHTPDGCGSCCIKGSGLKDALPTLTTGPVVDVDFDLAQFIAPVVAPRQTMAATWSRHPMPPPTCATLYSLRCQLLI